MMSTLLRSLVAGGTNMVRAVPRAFVMTASVAASSLAASRSAAVVNHATAARAGAPSVANVVKRNFATDAPAPFSVAEQLVEVTVQIRHLEKELAKEVVDDRVKLESRLEKLQVEQSVLKMVLEMALEQEKKEAALAQKALEQEKKEAASLKLALEKELEEKKEKAALAQKALVAQEKELEEMKEKAALAQKEAALAAATPIVLSEAAKELVRAADDASTRGNVTFGFALVELTKQVCAELESPVPCKSDPKSWGVTGKFDARLTPFEFSDFKTDARKKTELAAIKYMSEPSQARQDKMTNFGIAATIAAPGTGKTRLLDDLLRATLPTTHYKNFLRLPITFNGTTTGSYKHPLVVRALFQFVCGYVLDGTKALLVLDHALHAVYTLQPRPVELFDWKVLDAIEAVYFQLHGGGTLGRSVLLVDELALASFVPPRVGSEYDMYKFVVGWIDHGAKGDQHTVTFSASRRGAVFTGASILSPAMGETDTTRPVEALPLGIFNVNNDVARNVIQAQAGGEISRMVWALLAATSGRPRDILDVFEKLKKKSLKPDATEDMPLYSILTTVPKTTTSVFSNYLLPSLLGVQFKSFTSNGRPTQFGRDAVSLSLTNADAASNKIFSGVPAVSLRFVETVTNGGVLPQVVRCLVSTMVFSMLDSSGKDFERAWALLTMCVLQLQFLVRCSDERAAFWPVRDSTETDLGGPDRPTAQAIDLFAAHSHDPAARLEALFPFPRPEHVFEAPGSTIRRKIALASEPTLAVWRNAWEQTVLEGPPELDNWPKMKRDVVWRSSTIVFFDQKNMAAVDFMLLVGEAGGTGAREPHVYMFQCKAWKSRNVAQANMAEIVAQVDNALDTLFSDRFAESNVLRKAGVHERRQVTLCVAAISFGEIDWKLLAAPFNIVLFDGADFRAMCGSAFVNTTFCQQFSEPVKEKPVETKN